MRIDAHQHFWRFHPDLYPWIQRGMEVLRRDFLPADLEKHLSAERFDGCIAVQARHALEETRDLLDWAGSAGFVRGVVGWIDLCAGSAERELDALAGQGKLCGIRHIVQDERDDEFLLREDFQRGLRLLRPRGLTYDLLLYPKHLPVAVRLVERFPDQAFVLDHLAKPHIARGEVAPWEAHLRELARHPNVYVKISGLVTEADWHEWKTADFRPYLDVAFEAFGEDRVMFGSDWPVCLLASSYANVVELVREYTAALGADAERKFFGENALRFYGLTLQESAT